MSSLIGVTVDAGACATAATPTALSRRRRPPRSGSPLGRADPRQLRSPFDTPYGSGRLDAAPASRDRHAWREPTTSERADAGQRELRDVVGEIVDGRRRQAQTGKDPAGTRVQTEQELRLDTGDAPGDARTSSDGHCSNSLTRPLRYSSRGRIACLMISSKAGVGSDISRLIN